MDSVPPVNRDDSRTKPGTLGEGRARPARVVVVEDNPVTLKVLRVTLETDGYEVFEAGDGRAALDVIEATAPHLVILDYVLPDMNGEELCDRIRQIPHGREIPVILLIGLASKALARPSPFAASLLKPAGPAQVLETVRAVLSSGKRSPSRLAEIPRADDAAQRSSMQAAALSLMGAMAELLSRPGETTQVLGEVLLHSLDAAGLSSGALYLRSANGRLQLQSQAGLVGSARDAAQTCFGAPELLDRIAGDEPKAITHRTRGEAELRVPLSPNLRHFPTGPAHPSSTMLRGMDRLRVLIVDDAADFRESAAALLSRHPQVQVVGYGCSGEEGVRLAQDVSPDVVLMDIAMPGIGGLEAVRRIKGHRPSPRVVVITLHDEPDYHGAAIRAGADALIGKADFTERVLAYVDALLSSPDLASSRSGQARTPGADTL